MIPRPYEPTSLAQKASFCFSERPCFKGTRQRIIKKDVQILGLVSVCACKNVHLRIHVLHTHIHDSTYTILHHIQTQRRVGKKSSQTTVRALEFCHCCLFGIFWQFLIKLSQSKMNICLRLSLTIYIYAPCLSILCGEYLFQFRIKIPWLPGQAWNKMYNITLTAQADLSLFHQKTTGVQIRTKRKMTLNYSSE